jgi:hypothetical protein
MIVIKGWTYNKNLSVICKIRDNLTLHQAWMLVQTAKFCDERIGHIRLVTRPERFEYYRRDDGRIIIRQIS